MGRSKPERTTDLGAELRALRKAQDRTLRQVETASGLTNGYLSQLERGEVGHPSPTVLRKLAEGYEVPFPVILQWAGYLDEERPSISPNQAAALSTIGEPSTEELKALRGIMDLLRKNRTVPFAVGIRAAPAARLDVDARREITSYARALLLEADALGRRPTPLSDLEAAARLVRSHELDLTPQDKADLRARFGRWVDLGWKRLRGAVDFRSRSIWIKPDLPEKARPFVISHEIGHAILPAHQEFFAYVDNFDSLSPQVREPFEKEANFAATQLLFQCGQLAEEVDASSISLGSICDVAALFGASIVSTAREVAESSRKEVAVAIGFQPQQMMGPTQLFTSESFEQRYRWRGGNVAPWQALRQELVGARQTASESEWGCADVSGRQTVLRVESLHTNWAAIVLVVHETVLRRGARRLLSRV